MTQTSVVINRLFSGFLQTPERILDAPDIQDNFYMNLLDWSKTNVVTIALGNSVYLWNAKNGSTSELVSFDDEDGPVTSVSWAPDGRHLAIGLNSSRVQIWDSAATEKVCYSSFCFHVQLNS